MVKLELLQLGTKNNKFVGGLKFSSINVKGIRSKKLELLAYLNFHQPQIVAIQETRIDSSISTSELFPETCPYNVYRKDRNSKGGGVLLLIYKRISHICPSQNWKTTQNRYGLKCSQIKLIILWQVGFNLLAEIWQNLRQKSSC